MEILRRTLAEHRRRASNIMPIPYGPWLKNVKVGSFLHQVITGAYAGTQDSHATMRGLIVPLSEALGEELVLDVGDLQEAKRLVIERAFSTVTAEKSVGLTTFALKHLGTEGNPWKQWEVSESAAPPGIPASAPVGRWGGQTGGAANDSNFPAAILERGTDEGNGELAPAALASVAAAILKMKFSLHRKTSTREIARLLVLPGVTHLVNDQ